MNRSGEIRLSGVSKSFGDTHAVWKSHQSSPALQSLFDEVELGQAFTLHLDKVEVQAKGGEATEEVEVDL